MNATYSHDTYSGSPHPHIEAPHLLFSAPATGNAGATSATYTTSHSNTRSLTHRVRPGLELTSSWIRVRFVTICLLNAVMSGGAGELRAQAFPAY